MRYPIFRNAIVRNKTIWLDFAHLENVELYGCKLLILGLGWPRLRGHFITRDCEWAFVGPARNGACVARDLAKLNVKWDHNRIIPSN